MERFAINILHKQIQNICRLCGVDNPDKFPIVADEDDIICLDDDEPPLVKKIEECVGIRVYKTDQMPQQICTLCIDKVNDFYEYRSMCAATNIQTSTILNLPLIQPTSILIKTPVECPSDRQLGTKRGTKSRILSRKNDVVESKDFLGTSCEKRIKHEFVCQYCNEFFDTSLDMGRHLVVKHTPLVKKFGCGTCTELFDTATEYKDHNLWHKLTRTLFVCFRCNKKFVKSSTLNKHLVQNGCVRPEGKTKSQIVPDFRCKLCSKIFKTKNLYEWHSCFLRARANCPKCGKYFLKKNLLKRHYMFYCKGTLAAIEPAVETNTSRCVPNAAVTSVRPSREVKKRGRPPVAAKQNHVQDFREETAELPFPPLFELPQIKLKSVSSDRLLQFTNKDLENDTCNRLETAFEDKTDKIVKLLHTGGVVDDNVESTEISSILSSANETIATISHVANKKNKRGIEIVSEERSLDGNVSDIEPTVVLAGMNYSLSQTLGIPNNTTKIECKHIDFMKSSTVYTNQNIFDDRRQCVPVPSFSCYVDVAEDKNTKVGDGKTNIKESSSTCSTICEGEISTNTRGEHSVYKSQSAKTLLHVKQDNVTGGILDSGFQGFDDDSEAYFGNYDAEISYLAIKNEHANEMHMDSIFSEVDQSYQAEPRIRELEDVALRIKIKNERSTHDVTVVEPEVNLFVSPKMSNVEHYHTLKQSNTLPIAPKHFMVHPMRSKAPPLTEISMLIKQELPNPEDFGYANSGTEETYGLIIAPEQEPTDTSFDHLNLDEQELNLFFQKCHPREGCDAIDEGISSKNIFDGRHIKQEHREETSSCQISPAKLSPSVSNELYTNRGDELTSRNAIHLSNTQTANNICSESTEPINTRGSKMTESTRKKSSKRINPFALLKRNTVATTDIQKKTRYMNGLALSVTGQVTSIKLNENLALNASTLLAKMNSSERFSDLNESDSATVIGESASHHRRKIVNLKEKKNKGFVHNAMKLKIASVKSVRQNVTLAKEKVLFNAQLDPTLNQSSAPISESSKTIRIGFCST